MIEKGQQNSSTDNEKSHSQGLVLGIHKKGQKYVLQNSSSGWW